MHGWCTLDPLCVSFVQDPIHEEGRQKFEDFEIIPALPPKMLEFKDILNFKGWNDKPISHKKS